MPEAASASAPAAAPPTAPAPSASGGVPTAHPSLPAQQRIGTVDADGNEQPRATVTLATGIPEEVCHQINLGYVDHRTINIEDYADREDEGVYLERKAGERLYHLRQRPDWAGGADD